MKATTTSKKSNKIGEKKLSLRKELWPLISEDQLWHRRRNKGFTTIPRAMTYIMQIMNYLSSGKPVSQTYLALWCHTFDEYMITISNPKIMAFEAGFNGQRAETTWKGRMKYLVDLGFVEARQGISGPYHYVLLLNPFTAIKRLRERGEIIPAEIINTLHERLSEIGAKEEI